MAARPEQFSISPLAIANAAGQQAVPTLSEH
jgi:hypothetical protein